MAVLSKTWDPPGTRCGAVVHTRAWRIVTYGDTIPQAARLYVALGPESLVEGYELLFPLLEERRICHRHVRSPELLRAMEGLSAWAGKSVVLDPPEPEDTEALARELDERLAGRGLTGPTLIAGAQPLGGRTGLVFLRRQEPRGEQGGAARSWLTRLLGEGRTPHEPRSAGVHG